MHDKKAVVQVPRYIGPDVPNAQSVKSLLKGAYSQLPSPDRSASEMTAFADKQVSLSDRKAVVFVLANIDQR